jgi:hypothetical protein
VAAGARWWGHTREAGRGRGAGEGWHGSGILRVAFIGSREDTGGADGERGAPSMAVISKARTTSGRGCDEANASGRLACSKEGGAVAAAAAS